VFFLLAGRAQVVLYSSNGREVLIYTIGPGGMFGEMAPLDDQPRSASVLALSEIEYAMMRAGDFLACVESSPAAGRWMVRRLVASVRSLTDRLFELSTLNVQTRIHCELLRLAQGGELRGGIIEIHDPPTHADFANRIGTHREAVTRELRALSEMKIIRSGRRSLQILDLPRLERAANNQ
jgi:CRP-like cAMP-binding protein